jgi:hypothetical protein
LYCSLFYLMLDSYSQKKCLPIVLFSYVLGLRTHMPRVLCNEGGSGSALHASTF